MNRYRLLSLIAAALALAGMTAVFVFYRAALIRKRIDTGTASDVEQIARDHPGNLELVARAARRLIRLGQPQTAITILQGAQGKDAPARDRAAVDGLLAEAAVLGGQIDVGMAAAQRAFVIDPNNMDANFAMGLWWERQAAWHKAEEEFFPIAKARPKDAVALFHLANAELHQDEISRAAATMKSVVALAPSNYDYWRILAADEAYSGDFGESAKAFERALRLRPGGFEARANAARAKAFAARTYQQLRAVEIPLSRLLPGDPDAALDHEILGMVETHAGDTQAAQVHLETAARLYRRQRHTLENSAPEIFVNLAVVHLFNNQIKDDAQELFEADRAYVPLRKIALMQEAIDRQPNESQRRLELARLYEQYGAKADALGQYEAILGLDPGDSFAHSRVEALTKGTDAPEDETAWAWRVLSTEIGMILPHKQS
ncbi:MAG TPA: hypothetical protein VFJ58_09890 [Armatimonadota bacterium]|nr:hypothetical protein [Armatimonadota bacterium]